MAIIAGNPGESFTCNVRVVVKSARQEVTEREDGSLKVRVTCAPEKGRANRELLEVISRHFGVARSDVTIIAGTSGRNKVVRVERQGKRL